MRDTYDVVTPQTRDVYDVEYDQYDADWSPATLGALPGYTIEAGGNVTVLPNQMDDPQENDQARVGNPAAVAPAPPDPARFEKGDMISGPVGYGQALGWTRGIRPTRHLHQSFDGETLLMPPLSIMQDGPVGRKNFSDRLVYAEELVLNGETMQTNREVSEMLASDYSATLLQGVNPNYV